MTLEGILTNLRL